MVRLSEEAKKAIGEIRPALVATASKSGKPNGVGQRLSAGSR